MIYYMTKTGPKLVGTTDRIETASFCIYELKISGWEAEVYLNDEAMAA